ncbi:MAG TPA: sigma-70 family RNA polymerase sigma factor [Thermoanaerobaculia bacterium]|nr:sigma-70 family RNA polymerase sigma factor [Thermoanaerobaculia bacterium]
MSEMAWDDARLLRGLRAGDERAFEALLRTYMGRLLRVARTFLRNEEDARDAVQDAFVAAFRGIDSFQAGSKLSTWLHKIVVNACLMKLRSRRRHPEEEIDALLPRFQADGHQVRDSVDWALSAEDLVQQEETRQLVRKSIDRLPDTYRVVLLMRDIEEMSTEETAKALGITPTAVKVRLHRARQALRTLLDRQLGRSQ